MQPQPRVQRAGVGTSAVHHAEKRASRLAIRPPICRRVPQLALNAERDREAIDLQLWAARRNFSKIIRVNAETGAEKQGARVLL